MTLLPGLIDVHVHLTSDAEIRGYRHYQYTDNFWTVVGVANAKTTLEAGFTTVQERRLEPLRRCRAAAGGRRRRDPRAADRHGGLRDRRDRRALRQRDPAAELRPQGRLDRRFSPDEARAKVRWLHKYGAQVIKICATGGVFSTGDAVGAQQLTYDEMKAIADEAHMLGMKVAAHAHGDEGINAAIRAGIDTIEHASLASDATIALAKAHGTFFDMDIYNDDYILASAARRTGRVRRASTRKRRSASSSARRSSGAVHAGVKMAFATDAGVYPHGTNARQFATMVKWGMTPLQAIQAATVGASEALARPDVGGLAPGQWGDMIAVSGDPLGDITLLQSVPVVIKGGVVVKDARAR